MIVCTKYGMPPIVYIAGPYRAMDSGQFERHVAQAETTGLHAARKGWSPIIPHLNTKQFDFKAPDIGDDFWLPATSALLMRADAVLMTGEWRQSRGAIDERHLAEHHCIPVFDHIEDLPQASDWPDYQKKIPLKNVS